MKNLFSKQSIKEYKKIYREEGFKALFKKLGWKVFIIIFLYYLIRDLILYVFAPLFLFDFFSSLGLSKISSYSIILFFVVLFISFLIHYFNSSLRIKILRIASFLGLLAVLLGAFGAHGLKEILINTNHIYKTASLYHFISVFLMFFMALLDNYLDYKYLKISFLLCFFGVIIFSGSLYLLSITNIKIPGAITPIGGLFLAFSFISMFVGFKLKS